MPNFAVIDETSVINIIVADSKEIAEEVTGKTCIEFENEYIEIGGFEFIKVSIGSFYLDNTFIPVKPFNSWTLDAPSKQWIPPTPKPSSDPENPMLYEWDESTLTWIGREFIIVPE